MDSSTVSGSSTRFNAQLSTSKVSDTDVPATIFRTIPPERVGLHGEYDHHGLAKRVTLTFSSSTHPHEIADLQVSQRGTVVVLTGKVSTLKTLKRLIGIALNIDGATDVEVNVEVNGVKITHLELGNTLPRTLFNRHLYAC